MSIYDREKKKTHLVLTSETVDKLLSADDLHPDTREYILCERGRCEWEGAEFKRWAVKIDGPWQYDDVGETVSDVDGNQLRNQHQERLSSAAPELLESLVELYKFLQTVKTGTGYTITHVEKAIRKALPAQVAAELIGRQ